MNKQVLQGIVHRLELAVKSSKPNVRYSKLMNLVGELNNAINQLEVVEEPTTEKKSKRGRKKKTSTED